MRSTILTLLFWFISIGIFAQKIHSHNDYLQKKPFWTAYKADAESIEVDIFLKNNTLFVAHSEKEIKEVNTLTAMYFEPISKLILNEKIKPFQLLIDIKTEAEPTLDALIFLLDKFPNLKQTANLSIVISGERPLLKKYSRYPNFINFDHQSLIDIENADLSKIALFSFSFKNYSKWNGKDELSINDKTVLRKVIEKVHSLALPIRFWATPDTALAWQTLHELGVDYINTDQPKRCKGYFKR
jgi:alkaline phosphatase